MLPMPEVPKPIAGISAPCAASFGAEVSEIPAATYIIALTGLARCKVASPKPGGHYSAASVSAISLRIISPHRKDFIDATDGLTRGEQTLALTPRLGRRDDLSPQTITPRCCASSRLALHSSRKARMERAQDGTEASRAGKRTQCR